MKIAEIETLELANIPVTPPLYNTRNQCQTFNYLILTLLDQAVHSRQSWQSDDIRFLAG